MADSRKLFRSLAVGAALALGVVLVMLVLRADESPAAPPDPASVVSRGSDARPPSGKPVISVPPADRRPAPPPPTPGPVAASVDARIVTAEHRPLRAGRIEALQGNNAGIPGMSELQPLGLRAVSDDTGAFTLSGVPAMTDLMLRVDGEEFSAAELGPFTVESGRPTHLGDLVIPDGLTITGTVFNEQGVPVTGARVGLLQGPMSREAGESTEMLIPAPVRLVLSDASGRFRIAHAAVESFSLMVSAKGYANAMTPGSLDPGERIGEIDVPVKLVPAGTLSGRVLDHDDDHPLAGAHVFAQPMDQGSGYSETLTRADGRFLLEDLLPGNYSIFVTLKGYTAGRDRSFADKPQAELTIRLERQGSLAGVVVGSDGRPIRAFDLQAQCRKRRLDSALPSGAFQRVTSADGSFVVNDIDPGFWSVDVWAKGYSLTSSVPMKVKQGEQVGGMTVTLLRGSTLTGVVRDVDGPVANATVTLHANFEPELDFLRDTQPIPGVPPQGVRTDAEGRFTLEDLSASKYQVQVDHPDYAIVRRNDVVLAAETELGIETFVLQRAGTVRGYAMSASGDTLTGVTVSLTEVNGFSRQTASDGHGQFVFTRVREGDYQLVCYGKQLSFEAMIASVRHPPETFRVGEGVSVQRNAISLE